MKYKVREIEIDDEEYPILLRKIPDPPKKLFCKGGWKDQVFENCLAVVGSRRMTLYGKKVLKHIFDTLNFSKLTIVSGFMTGVDASSHRCALEKKMTTVAVMPCGIDYIHPEDQVDLYNQILASGGLVISEYDEDSRPQLWTYPKRNRIVAGLCKAVLVVEAARGSGSLITADFARRFQRKVFCVPGSIFSDTSKGCLEIIKDYAQPICSGIEINEYFGLDSFSCSQNLFDHLSLRDVEKRIIETLKSCPATQDEISDFLDIPVSELSSKITLLMLNGLVEEKEGRLYVCKN